jgi:tRNA-2-methylthio-N6-dimethylallyladenosine synthase
MSFSFTFSPRPGTPAAEFPDQVAPEVMSERLKRLQTLVNTQSQAVAQGLVGSVQRVLAESVSRRDARELAGRLDNNRTVNFAGSAGMLGRFVEVKITALEHHTLRGELIAGVHYEQHKAQP